MKRLVAAILMTSYLGACVSWQVEEATPEKAAELRVTLADGRQLVLQDARVIGDSLVGFAPRSTISPYPGGVPAGSSGERVRLAFLWRDVKPVEEKKLNTGKTVVAIVGVGALVLLIVAIRNAISNLTFAYH